MLSCLKALYVQQQLPTVLHVSRSPKSVTSSVSLARFFKKRMCWSMLAWTNMMCHFHWTRHVTSYVTSCHVFLGLHGSFAMFPLYWYVWKPPAESTRTFIDNWEFFWIYVFQLYVFSAICDITKGTDTSQIPPNSNTDEHWLPEATICSVPFLDTSSSESKSVLAGSLKLLF